MQTWNDVLAVEGFSSAKNRLLLNLAVNAAGRVRILEVGSFLGSTAVAMCYGNDVECIHLVDNHSEFGDTRQRLSATVERFGLPATIHDFDYFAPMPANVFGGTKFNVYLYDGSHSQEDHARELAIALPHLDDRFLYIVDDYSWEQVRSGNDAGLAANVGSVEVVARVAYESTSLNDVNGYWNGLLVAWCAKR
jgi:hypothetical protein